MAAALMCNLSAVLNSASTLVTIDFYKKLFRPEATDEQQVRFRPVRRHADPVGEHGHRVVLQPDAGGAAVREGAKHVFLHRAAVLRDLLRGPALATREHAGGWRRSCSGFVFSFLFDQFVKGQQGVYLHRAFFYVVLLRDHDGRRVGPDGGDDSADGAVEEEGRGGGGGGFGHGGGGVCGRVDPEAVGGGAGVVDAAGGAGGVDPVDAEVRGVAGGGQAAYHGIKDFRLWWLIFVGIILGIYGFFLWFRLQYPVKMLPDWLWR